MQFRHHCLVGAILNPKVNPGDILILRGMEYLITQAELNLGVQPLFSQANLFDRLDSEDDNLTWSLVNARAKTAIFAGTPQFNKDGCGAHFKNLLHRMRVAREQGLVTAYFWLGSGYTEHIYSNEEAIQKMLEPNTAILAELKDSVDFIITRDEITHELLNRAGVPNERFLDCVFFACNWFNQKALKDNFNLIVLRGRDNAEESKIIYETSVGLISKMNAKYPTYFMVHEEREYSWWKQYDPNVLCVCLPNDLMRIYAQTHQLISFRVHGSVSALAMGKQVANILNDSRSNILETVGVPSIPQVNFYNSSDIKFYKVPNINEIKEKEQKRFNEYWKTVIKNVK